MKVDQTSASASKPEPSDKTVNLDPPHPRPPRPTSHSVENMEVDYGPFLPLHLGGVQSQANASDQHYSLSDEPFKVA